MGSPWKIPQLCRTHVPAAGEGEEDSTFWFWLSIPRSWLQVTIAIERELDGEKRKGTLEDNLDAVVEFGSFKRVV